MRELLADLRAWRAEGKGIAIATVVKVWGSAPRPLGSKMAVTDGGDMAGSVSGGCVEGAVYEHAQGVIASGHAEVVSFGVSDDDAWAVGLSCGGTIELLVEPLASEASLFEELSQTLEAKGLVARAVALPGGEAAGGGRDGGEMLIYPDGRRSGSLGSVELDARASALAEAQWLSFASCRQGLGNPAGTEDGMGTETELFVEIHGPPPRLVIVGAVHVASVLVTLAKGVGFETIVVDPRTAFATSERFGHADRLVHDWPDAALEALEIDANTFVVLLSHDLKLDVPALKVALPKARYIGCLGSKKTHQKRLARLGEAGVPETLWPRMHNPVGLNLGGRKAEEMAVSILAEVVAVSHGIDARPLV